MRVYIFTDLEGATGVVEYDSGNSERQKQDRFNLMSDVNAAIAGASDAGATKIVVYDGHGKGAISLEELDSRASLIKKGRAAAYLPGIDNSYDILILIGFHSMAGVGGVLSHTYSLRVKMITVNGQPIGEIGLSFLYAQYYGVRPIFITGDDTAIEEAGSYIPHIPSISVKKSISEKCAECLPPQTTCMRIREGVFKSLSDSDFNSANLPCPPYEMRVIYKKPWIALPRYILKNRFPGVRLSNLHTIVFRGSNFIEIMDKFIGVHKRNHIVD